MKNVNHLALLIIVLVIVSCTKSENFEEHKQIGNENRWDKSKVIVFKPEIKDNQQKHRITLEFRHVDGFQLKEVSFQIKLTSPEGIITNKPYTIKVFNDLNEPLSSCAGDYCDLDTVIEDQYVFSKSGTWTFEITHTMKTNPLPNVMEIGLKIEPIK